MFNRVEKFVCPSEQFTLKTNFRFANTSSDKPDRLLYHHFKKAVTVGITFSRHYHLTFTHPEHRNHREPPHMSPVIQCRGVQSD